MIQTFKADGSEEEVYRLVCNDRGSVIGVVNKAGTVVEMLHYSSSGLCKSYYLDGNGVEQPTLDDATGSILYRSKYVRFGFCGMYIEPFTGKGHTLYREYDQLHGMWMSRDPIAEDGGINLYAYCDGDPVNGVDELGLRPKLTTWLRSGGAYWDVNDMPGDLRKILYAQDYDQAGGSTKAAYHAWVGVAGVFEGAALFGWDLGEGLCGREFIGEENMIRGMVDKAMDDGVGALAKDMALAPVHGLLSGDAEQFGSSAFGLYIGGRQMAAAGKGFLNARASGASFGKQLAAVMKAKPQEFGALKRLGAAGSSAAKLEQLSTIRQQYNSHIPAWRQYVGAMRNLGASSEHIARRVSKARRLAGFRYKQMTPFPERMVIYYRNIAPEWFPKVKLAGKWQRPKNYDSIYGPSVDWLRKRNKSWDQIIETSLTPNREINSALGVK